MNWWTLLKQVDIDFIFAERAGWYGLYNRKEDEILINLSAFGGDYSKSGLTQSDYQRMEDIIETIMHEGGHAAALGKKYADLEVELYNWASDKVSRMFEGTDKKMQDIRPVLTRIVDYLINEYVAAIAEGKVGTEAMKNAYDQTIGALGEELHQLVIFFDTEMGEEPSDEIMQQMIEGLFGVPTQWEVTEYLIPLFDKYINGMGKIIFDAYKEGTSYRDKEAFKELTGEEPKPKVRGTLQLPPFIRDMKGRASENWMERLRGE
tara:strand:- start:62 stop:850 length:789 start_codon:yes stop_codon:yes gene_type:complete